MAFYILQNVKYIISLRGVLIEGVVKGIMKGVVNIGSTLRTDATGYPKKTVEDKYLRSFRVYVSAALRVEQPTL